MNSLFDIGSAEFYANWYTVTQVLHIALFGLLVLTRRWFMVAFPLLISAIFYLKTGDFIAFMEHNGRPIESYIFKALVDTTVCASIIAAGWKYEVAGWTRQAILLTIYGFIHVAAAVEYPMQGVTLVYSLYLPVTLMINVLQVLVMYDAIPDIRTIPGTIDRLRRDNVVQRLLRNLHLTKGLEQ